MSVKLAKSAGFCFGVSRAVELVEQAAQAGKRVATLGPIIHNRHVVDKFRGLGVGVIEEPEEAKPGQTVIIRSHGVTRSVVERLEKQGVEIIDATCPFVKRIHGIVSRAEEEGKLPVIIGTRSHPEVEGIAGWCNDCRIFETPEELEKWAKKVPAFAGLGISFLLFILLRNCASGSLGFESFVICRLPAELYRNYLTAYLGFPQPGFFSTDYFPLIPWFFLFVAGYFLHRVLARRNLNEKLFAKGQVPVLNWIGRHSLIVYLLHQPILYGLGMLIFGA